jgi:CRISPR system Cascade subunit CasD
MKLLLLRLDAPWMSFGAPIVDQRGVIQPYPGLSMLCGLLGNALGLHHRDWEALEALQTRIRYACREDARGVLCRDFHTVDLGQPFMLDSNAWSTRPGHVAGRAGASGEGTHIRERDYWAQARQVVALGLVPAEQEPTLDRLAQALDEPARPLFIGRKCCLPSSPLLMGSVEATSPLEALKAAPLLRGSKGGQKRVWWEVAADQAELEQTRPVVDRRDWRNQVHVGQRLIREAYIEVEEVPNER